ncbi:MAG: 4Fe-4S ferredoxin [Planctomycetes bacterium RBG_16_59_8]|nr:MAG: 4Fe-4S ferredoxin [Planctomycetes bacterium RBG_16_59_8]
MSNEISSPPKARKKPRGKVHVRETWCKGCGFCVEFCPTKVLAMSSGFNAKGYHIPSVRDPEKCNGCNLCGMLCPDFSIWSTKEEE